MNKINYCWQESTSQVLLFENNLVIFLNNFYVLFDEVSLFGEP